MLNDLKVSDLIKMAHDFYANRIAQLVKENEELRLYKDLVNKSCTDKELEQENIALRHRIADLEKEIKCWNENGTPF